MTTTTAQPTQTAAGYVAIRGSTIYGTGSTPYDALGAARAAYPDKFSELAPNGDSINYFRTREINPKDKIGRVVPARVAAELGLKTAKPAK
jgi:hypothetical protein